MEETESNEAEAPERGIKVGVDDIKVTAKEGETPNVVDPADVDKELYPNSEASSSVPDWVDIPKDLNLPRGVSTAFL